MESGLPGIAIRWGKLLHLKPLGESGAGTEKKVKCIIS